MPLEGFKGLWVAFCNALVCDRLFYTIELRALLTNQAIGPSLLFVVVLETSQPISHETRNLPLFVRITQA